MTCGVSEGGSLTFTDANGNAMPDHVVELAKKQNRQAILDLIERQCAEINARIESLGRLHHDTPDPTQRPKFVPQAFERPRPQPPRRRVPGFFDRLFGRVKRIEKSNEDALEAFHRSTAAYEQELAAFQRQMDEQRRFIEEAIYTDVRAMEQHLEHSLADIAWPRETTASFEISDVGATIQVDVDLPEIEEMPTKLAAVPARGLKLSVKELSPAKIRKLYAEHVHGVVFRMVGEAFGALPTVKDVVVSGYSQRRSAIDGQLRDEYLLSVRVRRADWETMDFAHLSAIDPVEALGRFEIRRQMAKNGSFATVEALDVHKG